MLCKTVFPLFFFFSYIFGHICVHDKLEEAFMSVPEKRILRQKSIGSHPHRSGDTLYDYGLDAADYRIAEGKSGLYEFTEGSECNQAGNTCPRLQKRAPTPVPPFQPIRIKFDFRLLDPALDPDICTSVGQWSKLGRPANKSGYDPLNFLPRCKTASPFCGDDSPSDCNCFYQCTEADLFTTDKLNYVLSVFNRSKAYLEKTLSVRRLPLRLDPSYASSGMGCGTDYVPINVPLNGTTALQDYANNSDYDLVLFVTVRSSRLMQPDTIAYACGIVRDWFRRPVFGHVNWGMNKVVYNDPDKDQEQFGVATHEISHALGFTVASYGIFLNTTNLVYDPFQQSPVLDQDTVVLVEDVVQSVYRNGVAQNFTLPDVTRIITPNVLQATRDHFGCPTLVGAELEDGGSSGTASSHWEKRIFENEYMTGQSSYAPAFSKVTLAFFQDTGYYSVNLSMATSLYYGKNEGCDFVQKMCDYWVGPYNCSYSQKSDWGCIPGRMARGVCQINTYATDITPVAYRYFPSHPDAGGNYLSDYCPYYRTSSKLLGDCTNLRHQFNNSAVRAESFSTNSRCLDSTLLRVSLSLDGYGGCYALRCQGNNSLLVRVVFDWIQCTAGKEIRYTNFDGRLKCPSASEIFDWCSTGEIPQAPDVLPTVTGVTPSEGTLVSGFVLTVTGTGLTGATMIAVGNTYCRTLVSTSDTTLVVACSQQDIQEGETNLLQIDEQIVGIFTEAKDDVAAIWPDGMAAVAKQAFTSPADSLTSRCSFPFLFFLLISVLYCRF